MTNQQDFRQRIEMAREQAASLPEPDAVQQRISQQLIDRVRQQIESAGGAISFAEFMRMALYEPGLGYYAAGSRKFGEQGDFTTAPELSPLFSYCLAHFCRELMMTTAEQQILEFGAGSGIMAADVLARLETLEALPSHYYILELSAELRQRQQQTIQERVPQLLDRVSWLEQLPEAFDGVVLANELLDAMPVERFYIDGEHTKQWMVSWNEQQGRLETLTSDASDAMADQLRHIEQYLDRSFTSGYESELSLAHGPWLNSLSKCLGQAVVLLIDYGYGRAEYYHPQRHMGTLMCHYRHRAHPDPFVHVGLQDITAYVDFTTLAEAAVASGMDVLGFTSQAGFLLENGLESLAPDPETASDQEMLAYAQQVKSLTLPSEMGERFKVMAMGKDFPAEVPGFRLINQLRQL